MSEEQQPQDVIADLLKDIEQEQARLQKCGELTPKQATSELSGTVMSLMSDLAKITGGLRDMYFEHDERLDAIEADEPVMPVMDEDDEKLFIEICGSLEGMVNTVKQLVEMSDGIATAAEFKTKIGKATPERMAEFDRLLDLAKKGTDRVAELATSEEEAESVEEDPEPEPN